MFALKGKDQFIWSKEVKANIETKIIGKLNEEKIKAWNDIGLEKNTCLKAYWKSNKSC
jgi:uncharacterized OsmC-like protein